MLVRKLKACGDYVSALVVFKIAVAVVYRFRGEAERECTDDGSTKEKSLLN